MSFELKYTFSFSSILMFSKKSNYWNMSSLKKKKIKQEWKDSETTHLT